MDGNTLIRQIKQPLFEQAYNLEYLDSVLVNMQYELGRDIFDQTKQEQKYVFVWSLSRTKELHYSDYVEVLQLCYEATPIKETIIHMPKLEPMEIVEMPRRKAKWSEVVEFVWNKYIDMIFER